ncbi:MAG: carbohydrate binding family 9 domain-containing protein, partial [Geodermatophilaceae bacterium]|nr:carbohydrate binding family 9 domain-containing protein [Geodermatophilaceae bacterium]
LTMLLLGAATLPVEAGAQQGDAAVASPVRVYPVDPERAPRPTMRAVRTTRPPVIDGRPDEPEWLRADSATDFVQQLPTTGAKPIYRTVVRVLYDADHLYVSSINYDPTPGRAITAGIQRDFLPSNSDAFALTLDTYADRRNSFLFLINPKGAVRDEQTYDDSRTIVEAWEGVIDVRTATVRMPSGDSAWTVEMAIPLRTLRFDGTRGVQDWGINFLRRVRRVNETSYWSPLERQYRVHRMSKAGTLTGLQGLRQGRNLQIKPYVVASNAQGAQVLAGASGTKSDVGGDLKYGVTPALTLDLTYNTDFSQVEVDQEQVNLTRFSRFFPERRDFFIENAGAFTFGDVEERNFRMGASLRDFTLFNSRRIGITPDGRPVPILGGGRVSGRVGAWNVGLLDMQTRRLDSIPGEQFAVGRARRNVFGNSDVGVLVSSRSGNGSYNRSYGADANLRPLPNMVINSYVAASDAPGDSSDGYAARASLGYRGRLWNSSAMWKRVSDQFDPGLGFVKRRGMQQLFATTGVHARPALPLVQEVNPYVEADYITDLSNRLQSRTLQAGLNVFLLPEGEVGVELSDEFDRLDAPFTIYPGQVITAGSYAWRDARVHLSTGDGRPLSATLSATVGGFYDGTRRAATTSVVWRVRYNLSLEGSAQRNNVTRTAGAFTADVASLRLRYAWSTSLFGSAYTQYNSQTRAFVTNARINFRYRPLSDVYLVYTERQDTRSWVRNERVLALKVTHMTAF